MGNYVEVHSKGEDQRLVQLGKCTVIADIVFVDVMMYRFGKLIETSKVSYDSITFPKIQRKLIKEKLKEKFPEEFI